MKVLCNARRCGWHGQEEEVLQAPNPFDSTDTLQGCPECKSVETIFVACDEPDCWKQATCGTPTPSGYRQTCGKHVPKEGK